MEILRGELRIKDLIGNYIEHHYITDADLVKYSDGTNAQEHYDDVIKHLTAQEKLKLFNLADNANLTYATKAELAGFQANQVVNDIASRDALENVLIGTIVYVKNATADTSVTLGGATYIFNGTSYEKVAEWESLDLVVNWDDIVGKPTSTVTEIDDAVAKKHDHANKPVLDTLNSDGIRLSVNGTQVANLNDVQGQVIISDTEPVGQMPGGIWIKPIA